MKIYDVIVIGGGPSGNTAAIYLGRGDRSVLVLAGAQPGGQLIYTTEVENFPGFPNGIMGPELSMSMEKQAKKFNAEILHKEVTRVELAGKIKKVWVGDTAYQSKTIIISTGAYSRMIGVGEEEFIGRGVSTCAVCDAAFFKNKKTFVVGGGDSAMEDAAALSKFASEVTIIHRRDEFRASSFMQKRVFSKPNVKKMCGFEVIGVVGNGKLSSIKVRNIKTGEISEYPADGLFVAIGRIPSTKLFEKQLELDEKGYIKIVLTALMKDDKWRVDNKDYWLEGFPTMTSMEGVFAGGDVVDYRYKQAITAAGMGCMAAWDAEVYLNEH